MLLNVGLYLISETACNLVILMLRFFVFYRFSAAESNPILKENLPSDQNSCCSTSKHNMRLRIELKNARKEIEILRLQVSKIESAKFCAQKFQHSPELIRFYTGSDNFEILKGVFDAMKPDVEKMIRWVQSQKGFQEVQDVEAALVRLILDCTEVK